MALLRTEAQWNQFFQSAGNHDDATSDKHAGIFVINGFTEIYLSEIHKETLQELGITVLGHKIAILASAKERKKQVATPAATSASATETHYCHT